MADVVAPPPPAASGWDRLDFLSTVAARLWAGFRRWPLWAQIVGWLFAFWLLIPVAIWHTGWSLKVKSVVTLTLAALMIMSATTVGTPKTNRPGPVAPVAAVAPATTATTTTTPASTAPARPLVTAAHKDKEKKPAKHQTGGASCPPLSHVLNGVYHPDRLEILARCRHAAGVVADIRSEEDGDYHILLRVDSAFAHLTNQENRQQQHGWLVVEYMPRDHGHLPAPTIGQHLRLLGAWVLDHDHGWNEIHPVWEVTMGGRTYRSGPWFGGSPVYSGSSDAIESCRTGSGKKCTAYGSSGGGGGGGDSDGDSGGGGGGGGNCTPGYSPCLPPMSDYDCANGEGDGPGYADSVQVTGSDPYQLDTDGDGMACETS